MHDETVVPVEFAENDAEIIATLRHMAAAGQVRFAGNSPTSPQHVATP